MAVCKEMIDDLLAVWRCSWRCDGERLSNHSQQAGRNWRISKFLFTIILSQLHKEVFHMVILGIDIGATKTIACDSSGEILLAETGSKHIPSNTEIQTLNLGTAFLK